MMAYHKSILLLRMDYAYAYAVCIESIDSWDLVSATEYTYASPIALRRKTTRSCYKRQFILTQSTKTKLIRGISISYVLRAEFV